MACALDALSVLTAELEEKANAGISLQEKSVLRALRMDVVRKRLDELSGRGWMFVAAKAVPTSTPDVAKVRFNLVSDRDSQLGAALAVLFKSSNNEFISIAEEVADSVSSQDEIGELPFVLATPSFAQAGSVVDNDPVFRRMEERRNLFTRTVLGMNLPTIEASTGTPVNTYSDTKYGTSEKTTGNATDYDTAEDISRDTETDIQDDDQA